MTLPQMYMKLLKETAILITMGVAVYWGMIATGISQAAGVAYLVCLAIGVSAGTLAERRRWLNERTKKND